MAQAGTEALLDWGKGKKRPRHLNAATHGCRAKELILPGERRADYNRLWEMWLGEYSPESEVDIELLRTLVNAAWRLRRSERALAQVERALHKGKRNSADWTDDEIRRVQLMQRYKTTDENSYYKALRNIELLKRTREQEVREAKREVRADARRLSQWEKEHPNAAAARRKALEEEEKQKPPLTPAQQLFKGQNAGKKYKRQARLEQWVEVTIEDGKAVTTLSPSNEQLIEEGKAMLPAPEVVYRHLHFPDGVPDEYAWAVPDKRARKAGGSGVQRMTIDTWLDVIERESERADGHIGATGVGNPPSEQENGCKCPVCAA